MKTLRTLMAASVIVALASSAAAAQAPPLGIAVGADAPSAMVETMDGKKVDLASMYGDKPVVLEFWATWCPLCKKMEPAMQAAREKSGKSVTFVSVGVPSNQSPEKQREYADKQHLTGDFVFDRDGMAMKAFSVPHTSYVVVIDKNKKVVYTGVGASQDIDAALRKAGQ